MTKEKIENITFALFRKRPEPLKDELVGYETWDKIIWWSYSQPDTLGARGWNGHYIPHDYKIRVSKI